MSEDNEKEGISRRGFMKVLGAGSLGLGVLSFIPSAASQLRITPDSISVEGNNVFSSDSATGTTEYNGFVLDKRSSDPSTPEVGQMWYRTDLDT